jgi:NTP pyrophosphatase (non-canonical NTP hydrolase)
MSERPTPETDHVWQKHQGTTAEFFDAILIHARRLERQRDELLDELTVIRTVASYPNHPNALHAIQSISKNAIAAVKGDHT